MTALAPIETPDAARPADVDRMRLGRWLRTTPGLLRLLSIAAVVALVVLGVSGTRALTARRDAARSVGLESGPQLTMAHDLYSSLADADATASGALLRKGFEPEAVRRRYLWDLERADRLLVALAERGDLSPKARRATRTIATEMSTYAGRIETARTHSRLGNPVSAAYMREASAQMRTGILPAATTIWTDAARHIREDYETGTSGSHVTAVAVTGILATVVLVAALVFLARRTNRLVNLGVLAAAALVLAVVAWSVLQMTREQDALVRAQRRGSDPVQLLSATQILALQAQADASLALAERGTGAAYVEEFDRIAERLVGADVGPDGGPDGGMEGGGPLDTAREVGDREGDSTRIDAVATALREYLAVARQVREMDEAGDYDAAVERALSGDADGLAGTADELNARVDDAIAASRSRFSAEAADARRGFGALVLVLAIAMVAAIACVLVGVQPRIGEYR